MDENQIATLLATFFIGWLVGAWCMVALYEKQQ
jgi:hypothetical protein